MTTVRNLFLGFLIAGSISLESKAIVPSTLYLDKLDPVIYQSENKCNLAKLDKNQNCSSSILSDNIDFRTGLWLQQLTNLILPGWKSDLCWQQSPSIAHQSSVCLPSWTNLLEINPQSSTMALSEKILTDRSTANNSPKISASSKFPALSRSSLIVSPPEQNPSICNALPIETSCLLPNTLELTNPAPETQRIASPFGWRIRPYSGQVQFHQGIDYGAPLGSPVVAAGNGIVTKVVSGCIDFGNKSCGNQLGNWIEIDHGNGAIAVYGHLLNKSIQVKTGMKVRKNQEIAKVGSSGWSTGAHLDFRLEINGQHQNPADYIAVELDR